jgi:hypothetical protein
MPVAYEFDGNVIVLRAADTYATSDLKVAVLEALDDERLPRQAVMLLDLRESRSLQQRTADDVRDMARFLVAHGKRFGNRLAVVAPGDLGFGLMRLGAVTAETGGVSTEVFRDIAAAREWLAPGALSDTRRNAS